MRAVYEAENVEVGQNRGGEVGERTADFYAMVGSEAVRDPTGPASGSFRVARGTTRDATWIRATAGDRVRPEDRNSDLGFRCVQAPVGTADAR